MINERYASCFISGYVNVRLDGLAHAIPLVERYDGVVRSVLYADELVLCVKRAL